MDLIAEPGSSTEPTADLALSHALLRQCNDGLVGSVLRIHRPRVPMVVFGRRDIRLPGYAQALAAAVDEGVAPASRAAGGRAVAYTRQTLFVDEVGHQRQALTRQEPVRGVRAALRGHAPRPGDLTPEWVQYRASTIVY